MNPVHNAPVELPPAPCCPPPPGPGQTDKLPFQSSFCLQRKETRTLKIARHGRRFFLQQWARERKLSGKHKTQQKTRRRASGKRERQREIQMTSLFDVSDLHWWNNNYDISVQCIAIDVCARRRDLVSVRLKSGSARPGLSVTNLSFPHPPCRAWSAWTPSPIRSKSKIAGPGLFVTDLSLPHPPRRAWSAWTPGLVRHRCNEFIYMIVELTLVWTSSNYFVDEVQNPFGVNHKSFFMIWNFNSLFLCVSIVFFVFIHFCSFVSIVCWAWIHVHCEWGCLFGFGDDISFGWFLSFVMCVCKQQLL